MATSPMPVQQSFDDLGAPLVGVTFCVIDLETTGASPNTEAITEVGAATYRGGVCLGTFQTLVNPGASIPPMITWLTGITEDMVGPAPTIEAVLPSLIEFVGDSVIVGHNVRFDLSFLHAAADRLHYPRFSNRVVDTCKLARRLVRDEVPDCKLSTLARGLRLPHQPRHRALDDVLATADLLHVLLERAAGYGVLGLDDLLELPTIGRHAQAGKLRLTNDLPRGPGVYVFRGRAGEVLYVGKATNLRARVRSYFGSDDRRKVAPLLAQLFRIDHIACSTPIEAAVREIRLIQQHLPRFNRVSTTWPNYAYVRVRGDRGAPRITVTKQVGDGWHLGPLSSIGAARAAAGALVDAAQRSSIKSGAELVGALRAHPEKLLAPLHAHMHALAREDRFEEAAAIRDRSGVLARAIERQRRCDALRHAGVIELRWQGEQLLLRGGRLLVGSGPGSDICPTAASVPDDPAVPLPAALIDEIACVSTWLEKNGARATLLRADHGLAVTGGRLPRFEPIIPPGNSMAMESVGRRSRQATPPRSRTRSGLPPRARTFAAR